MNLTQARATDKQKKTIAINYAEIAEAIRRTARLQSEASAGPTVIQMATGDPFYL